MRTPSILFLLTIVASLTLSDCSTLCAQGGRIGKMRQGSQAAHGLSKPKSDIKVRLPVDGEKVVLVLDNVGGFRMKDPAGFEPTPMLQIFADGRVLTGTKSNLVKEVEGQIDLVDLKQLLVFVSDDCRFFDLTSEMLKSDIEANQVARIVDAPTTQLEVSLKDHSNKVSVYGLPYGPGRLAEVPSVAAMIGIMSRCRRLIALTRLGSKDDATKVVAAVNKTLGEKSASSPKFTLAHLQSAEQFVDGRRSASFVQNFADANGKPMMAYAMFETSSAGNVSVNLDVVEKKPQRGL